MTKYHKENFVSYRKARLLKRFGFNEPCANMYDTNGNFCENVDNAKDYIACPSLEQTKEWLSKKFNLHINISINTDGRYVWEYKYINLKYCSYSSLFNSFCSENDALIDCLNEIIEDIYTNMCRNKTLIKKESPEEKRIKEKKEKIERIREMSEAKFQAEKEREQMSKEVEEMIYGRKHFLTPRHRIDDAWRRMLYGIMF